MPQPGAAGAAARRAHPGRAGAARRPGPPHQERGRDAADPRPADRHDPAGSDELAQPGVLDRHADARAGRALSRPSRPGADRAGGRAAGRGAHPVAAAAAARVPAPALGRHAPAGGGRHGHRGAAAPAHRGRADHEPRPHDPGAVPGPPQGAPAAAPVRPDLRHPQSRDRGEDLRPGGRDVRGAHRRDGAGAAALHPARASLQPGPARVHPAPGRAARSASPPSRASRRTWRGLPGGCAFAPRCPHVMERCRVEAPPERPVGDGHVARCWLEAPA